MPQTNDYLKQRLELIAPKLIDALNTRGFEAWYCNDEEEALKKALSLIPNDAVVSWGGSESVCEIGLIEAVKERGNPVIDRDTAKSPEERVELMRKALLCDVFLTSANAISQDGQLVSVDGIGNRVAAQAFGPKNVLFIIGANKICPTLEDAVTRARKYASPVNAVRVGAKKTACASTGICGDCKVDESICSYVVTTRRNRVPGRMKIIIIGKNLGF